MNGEYEVPNRDPDLILIEDCDVYGFKLWIKEDLTQRSDESICRKGSYFTLGHHGPASNAENFLYIILEDPKGFPSSWPNVISTFFIERELLT